MTSQDQDKIIDLFVIGGGINGAGIANDAAGRGLSVTLCEQNDFASATSSASSKLIHGGLRYLEYYEFRLVKEALGEREVLLNNAPHLVQPLAFTLPHRPHLRPAWMIRLGLYLYSHMGKKGTLPAAKGIRFDSQSPLKAGITKGFLYYDCWVDDARLVISNALAAHINGALMLTNTQCTAIERDAQKHAWRIETRNTLTQQTTTHYAKAVVNAAGPWVKQFFQQCTQLPSPHNIRLVKGSHIIVPKFHDAPGAFILQNSDKRIVFVLPYQNDFHLIGTTDKEYTGDPAQVTIDNEEIEYLLSITNQHFKKQLEPTDIVSRYSGVRPLRDDESEDPSALTRDYTIALEDQDGTLPIVSIFGGKITTYRKLAEAALQKLSPYFNNMAPAWTARTSLPGATSATKNIADIEKVLLTRHPWLPNNMLKRFSHSYGLLCSTFLSTAQSTADLGEKISEGFYQAEVDYLVQHEWAQTTDDILWRRTKLGLRLTPQECDRLKTYLDAIKQPNT